MADVVYRLKGHEKFPLREGWLAKGLKEFKDNETLFLQKDAPDKLGVGTNMVKSIRYWMQACGLIVRAKDKKESLSELGEIISCYDPYFEDEFTLWLLHSNLVCNKEFATTWYMFFNKLDITRFTKELAHEIVLKNIEEYIHEEINPSSLKDDIDVLFNMYTCNNRKNEDPEDKMISPFTELGLLKAEINHYIKFSPDTRKLSEYIILYELSKKFKDVNALSIDDAILHEEGICSIYNLSHVEANRYLDKLDALKYIRVNRTAGLDMIYKVNVPESPIEVVKKYYEGECRL